MTTQLTYLELLSNEQFMKIHGRLVHVSRAGWVMRGVKNPENVLDHTEDLISLVDLWEHELAIKNPDQLKIMLKIHDWPEILIGDATLHQLHGEQFLQAQAIKHHNERVAMKKLCETLGALGGTLFDLWDQYEKNETHDIQIGHQLDKVQGILQALNYEQAGEPVETIGFIENALEKNQIHHPFLIEQIEKIKVN